MTKARGVAATLAVGAVAALSWSVAAETVTLTVYVRTSTAENQWEKQAVQDFEALHPDIKVNLIDNAGQDYQDKLTSLWASGNPPDVWDHGGAVATYRHNGWLLDLGPYIQRDKAELNIGDIFPSAWNAYVHPEFAAGLPFITLPSPVWLNLDMFEAAGLTRPPTNWDDSSWNFARFDDAAKKMTRVDAAGKVTQWGAAFETDPTDSEDIVFPWLNGGSWFDQPQTTETGIAHDVHFTDPANVEAYQKELDMVYKENSATIDIWGTFQQGKAAMAVTEGGWMGFGFNSPFKLGATSQPWMQTTADPIYTDPWMIGSQTKHPEAAWTFIKYVTSEAGLRSYLGIATFPPVRRSVLQPYLEAEAKLSHGGMTPAQYLEVISGGEKYGHETQEHALAGWYDVLHAISPTLTDMFNNKISPKEAMQRLQQVASPIVARYRDSAAK